MPSARESEPGPDAWEGLPAFERERRAAVLADIARRIEEYGPHKASYDPDRGRIFMPFAALKGYEDMVRQVEGALDEG